jgi:hypothetical protein
VDVGNASGLPKTLARLVAAVQRFTTPASDFAHTGAREELTKIFSARNFAAALVLLLRASEEERSASELIWRLPTFPQRNIRPGTGPNFRDGPKSFWTAPIFPDFAQNLFRRPEAFWVRPKTFPSVAKLLGVDQKLLDPS